MKELESLKKQILRDFTNVKSITDVNVLKQKYLGSNGIISTLFRKIASIAKDQRKEYGSTLNTLKQDVVTRIDNLRLEFEKQNIDKTEGARDIDLDAPWNINAIEKPEFLQDETNRHPINMEIERFLDVFRRMGFKIFNGRELDNDYYNFESLAMPKEHPAREMWDTFYTEEKYIPAVHTSNMQVRIMRLLKKPPIRAVIYSKCFRNEEVDATHSHTFHQIEGLYIDKKINIGNMLFTLKAFLQGFFERKLIWRLQPAHFPFVEPGIEAVIQCVFCEGKGCPSCKYSGWLEVLGAGMIHPDVLRNGGLDPNVYTGFAWGPGLERMLMNKNNIKDIRLLYQNDLRLLKAK